MMGCGGQAIVPVLHVSPRYTRGVSEGKKSAEPQSKIEDKPGAGVDRTTIHGMLRMTPEQRLKNLVAEANTIEEFFSKMQFK